jgi:ParB family chromosome partitioning protein
MQKSLYDLQEAGMRVDAIEAMIEAGEHVVSLDPTAIELSPIRDRFDGAEADEEFCSSIKEKGQIVPILVRPLEGQIGRYQVVYGRRRLSAATKLGIAVKALIKALTDNEAIALQALENAQRKDLSFIERAVFAFNLDEMGFRRDEIGAVLRISKSKLSEMISIPKEVGLDVIHSIGAAKEAGWRPWMTFAHLMSDNGARAKISELIRTSAFSAANSDERLKASINLLVNEKSKQPDSTLPASAGALTVRRTARQTLIAIDRRTSGGFADFLEQKLPELYSTYQMEHPTTS